MRSWISAAQTTSQRQRLSIRKASRPPSPTAKRVAIIFFAAGFQCGGAIAIGCSAALSYRLPARLRR
jgi:hypothetical protein